MRANRNDQTLNLINILGRAGVLKEVRRTGWVLKGVEEAESVADHSWRMSLLVMLLADGKLDKEKLLEMCVVHDLGEIGIGDIKWESGRRVISSQAVKHKDELKVFEDMFCDHTDGQRYVELLREFNEQKTPEARFIKQIDKLEMILTALEYEQRGYPADLFDEFWENAEKYLEGQSLEPIFRALQKLRRGI